MIAALGTLLVFLHVRGADTRADQRYGAVQVLRCGKQIDSGETIDAAQASAVEYGLFVTDIIVAVVFLFDGFIKGIFTQTCDNIANDQNSTVSGSCGGTTTPAAP